VVELLRRLHDRFEQVILITHIDSVREGLDRVMTVRFDEEAGCSRVHLSDGEQAGNDAPESLADAAFEGSEAAD
jgi:exonuclease SbcC